MHGVTMKFPVRYHVNCWYACGEETSKRGPGVNRESKLLRIVLEDSGWEWAGSYGLRRHAFVNTVLNLQRGKCFDRHSDYQLLRKEHQARQPWNRGSSPGKEFFSFAKCQTASGAQSAPYPIGTGGLCNGGKANHFTAKAKHCVEQHLHCPTPSWSVSGQLYHYMYNEGLRCS